MSNSPRSFKGAEILSALKKAKIDLPLREHITYIIDLDVADDDYVMLSITGDTYSCQCLIDDDQALIIAETLCPEENDAVVVVQL